jgi:NADH dehydrogenase FAD-containing subunit
MAPKVLVLGSNFAGLTAALAVKHELQDDVDVTVISKDDRFIFNPSFIWIPFGKRTPADITFPVAPTFDAHQVDFVHAEATRIDPQHQQVQTTNGTHGFDYLVVATGYREDFTGIPGAGPGGPAHAITSLHGAVAAADGWNQLLADPGPVVVAAAQGTGCFGAAYEFVFNLAYQLRKHGLKQRTPITYVTAEPFLGHFGIGGLPGGERLLGMFLKHTGIQAVLDTAIAEVVPGELRRADGRPLPFHYAVVVPPFVGAQVVRTSGLGNASGFVEVQDTYQTKAFSNIYAVGIGTAVSVPWQTANAVGVPKTGFPAETMAHVAATNIAAQIRGEQPVKRESFAEMPAVCIMDAGNNGVVILADRMLPPRKHGVLVPGPQSHAAKVAFEKYFLWKTRHGYVGLP